RCVMPIFIHGASTSTNQIATPEYRAWNRIIYDTENPRSKNFHNYGGRGITMCDRRRHSFPQFLADVGLRPSPRHSLDRINNEKGYVPRNVRWPLPEVQCNNMRVNPRLTFKGRSQTVSQWARELGINRA